jgi:outer membrane protein TolC
MSSLRHVGVAVARESILENRYMRTIANCRAATIVAATVLAFPLCASAQAPAAPPAPQVRRLTVDEAVRLALEHNLGIQVARVTPLVEDLGIAAAQAAWSPTFTSTLQSASNDSPNNSFLSGAQGTIISDARVVTNVGVEQTLRWGGSYSVGWDTTRSTTTNLFSNFSPQLRSSLALSYRQPLLRGFRIDSARQALLVSEKNREIADVGLRQTIASTTRAVRVAYWDLAYAIASLSVQRQSLELAQESLRNTRARVEIGTTPPIDIVEAEAEVATREEAAILAEAQIQTSEDVLRALIYDPDMPDFWTVRLEPSELPAFQPVVVNLDSAVRTALDRRTDLQQVKKTLESNDINIRSFRNETLPDVTASFDYGLTGLGGTQFLRGAGFPGPIVGQTQRGFSSVLGDLFGNDYPNWTASLSVSYPIGATRQQANLARARLQYSQSVTDLKNRQLQVVTEVRNAARQVQTNQKRVETTRTSRQLAERRLEAEQRKFTAGTSTSFFVFQAQRDLALARNNELRAILDYNRSTVDLETVQETPLTAR